ncbi:hypothetical protein ACFWR4_39060 [Streptomyces hydrogenans]|uniref:hypothetical protein n=2 Tax=Streptomyces hydrogenans TaxID=1873719 RepID=UPI0035E09332
MEEHRPDRPGGPQVPPREAPAGPYAPRWARLAASRGQGADAGRPLAALAAASRAAAVPVTRWTALEPRDWTLPPLDGRRCGAPVPVSVRGWLVGPDGTAQRLGPTFNNLSRTTVEAAVAELAGRVDRHAPAGSRCVVAAQRFVPAEATVLAHTLPDARTVRLRMCWGLAEPLGDGLHFDTCTVRDGQPPEDYRVTLKPTATAAMPGGTGTVGVPPRLRGRPVLSPAAALDCARAALDVAGAVKGPCDLVFSLTGPDRTLLDCRPL